MALRIADLAVDKVYVGADPVTAVYIGADLAWSAFSAQGMDKNGAQSPSTTLAKVTGWTARSGSAVASDSLVVSGTGTADIVGSIAFTAITDHYVSVRLNGSEIGRSPTVDRGTLSVTIAGQHLNNGDILELYAYSFSTQRTGIAAAGTFLTVTPAN